MKQVKCGCEFNADTLVSLCPSHAAYFAEKFRKEAPERAPLNSKQEALRNQILVASMPAVIARLPRGVPQRIDETANALVSLATATAART